MHVEKIKSSIKMYIESLKLTTKWIFIGAEIFILYEPPEPKGRDVPRHFHSVTRSILAVDSSLGGLYRFVWGLHGARNVCDR